MSDRKPLKVVLSRDGRVWLQSSTNRFRRVVIGEWYGDGDKYDGVKCGAEIWATRSFLRADDADSLRYAIADRVPAIAEFVSQRCEK